MFGNLHMNFKLYPKLGVRNNCPIFYSARKMLIFSSLPA